MHAVAVSELASVASLAPVLPSPPLDVPASLESWPTVCSSTFPAHAVDALRRTAIAEDASQPRSQQLVSIALRVPVRLLPRATHPLILSRDDERIDRRKGEQEREGERKAQRERRREGELDGAGCCALGALFVESHPMGLLTFGLNVT